MVRKKSPAAHRPIGRKLTHKVWLSWLGVVMAVIVLALITLMAVLIIRQAADTSDGCGEDVTNEYPRDRWDHGPDERVGEDPDERMCPTSAWGRAPVVALWPAAAVVGHVPPRGA